jgi:hypothetical protein
LRRDRQSSVISVPLSLLNYPKNAW